MIDKIWLVTQESNVDGQMIFDVVPCASEETARKVMRDKITALLNDSHFAAFADRPTDFVLEQTETSYYIEDTCDDYYKYVSIEEKQIQY